MSSDQAKNIFALACLICMLAIAVGAVLEIGRQRRGESILRPGLFRLRIFSALVWMIALGSLAYAMLFLWPAKDGDGKTNVLEARKFLSVLSGSFMLIFVAIVLLGYDVLQFARQRRLQEARFNRQLDEMAREEITKMNEHKVRDESDGANAGTGTGETS